MAHDIDPTLNLNYGHTGNNWTQKESELFIEAVRLYGKNYDQIMAHMGGSRNRDQVRGNAFGLAQLLKQNPDHPDHDVLEILTKPATEMGKWSDEENRLFEKASKLYGKDFDKISFYMNGSKNAYQCRYHALYFADLSDKKRDIRDYKPLTILQQK